VYRDSDTPLVAAARQQAVPVVDGLELLIGQGALSFEPFTGGSAPIEAMRAAVRGR
jgi:shikimate dehydrogenase